MADAVGNRARTKRGHVAWASHSLCDTQRVTKTWASVALVRARWRVPPLVGFHDCWLLDSLWCFTCSPHGGLFGMLKGGTAHAAIPCEAGDGWKYHRPPDESTPPHPGRSSVSAGRRPSAGGGVCSSAFAYLSCLSSCANHWSSGTISIPRSNKGNTSSARARMCCRMSCSQRPQLSSCQRAVADAQTPRRATVGSAGWAAWLAGKGSRGVYVSGYTNSRRLW